MFVWKFGRAASLRSCDIPSLSFRSPYILASIVKDNSVFWSWKLGKPAIPLLWLLWLYMSYCHLAGTTESGFHNNWILCFAASCFFNSSLYIYLTTLQWYPLLLLYEEGKITHNKNLYRWLIVVIYLNYRWVETNSSLLHNKMHVLFKCHHLLGCLML
jgi:hypothetical protein